MTSLHDLRQMTLGQLKNLTKEQIHAIIQKDNDDTQPTQRLQNSIDELNRKLSDEVLAKLNDIPNLRKELDEIKETVNKQASVLEQQQRFLEQLDAKDRAKNLVITGVSEDQNLQDAENDRDKCNIIFQKIEVKNLHYELRRIGKAAEGRSRPILITLRSAKDREDVLGKTRKLKQAGDEFKKIYVKKDQHPAVRKEWKRLFDAKREEEGKPENVGVTITMDTKQRVLRRNNIVIDRWKPSFFV